MPRRLVITTLSAVLLAVATSVAGGSERSAAGATGAAAVAPNPGVLRPWAPAYMDRTPTRPTQAQAATIAQEFDVIVAKPAQFAGLVPAMKAANPHLVIVAYLNGTMADSTTAFPSSWYLRATSGVLIKTVQWDNWAMNPGNPLWVQNRVQACRAELSQSGYDGCFLDAIGRSVVDGSGYVDGIPVNPATGQDYTINQFLAQTGALADAVRAAIAPKLVYGNNVGTGKVYFDAHAPTSQLLSHVDTMMCESFVRSGRAPLNQFNSPAVWLLDVKMLQDAASRGVPLITVTKAWAPGTQAQKDALHEFALGTFLLGADGTQRFSFLYDESLEPTAYSSWWDTPIGDPMGDDTALPTGVYARTFTNGYVAVNPNGAGRTLQLMSGWTTIQGASVGPGSITLPAHTAVILHH